MKKTLAALLAASMALSLCACGGGSKPAETTAAAAESGATEAAGAAESAGGRAKTVTLGMNTQISTLDRSMVRPQVQLFDRSTSRRIIQHPGAG